jgi:pimeloyl-ACP methyl ester carboxylesterase
MDQIGGLLDLLLPSSPRPVEPEGAASSPSPRTTREKLRELLRAGQLDSRTVEMEVAEPAPAAFQVLSGQGGEDLETQLRDMMPGLFGSRKTRRRVGVVEAREILLKEEQGRLVDRAALVRSGGMAAISEMVPPRWFTPDFIARQPAAVAFVMEMLHATDPAGYAGCAEAIAGMDLRPALGAIKAPTLVIAGAEDQAAPPWQGAMTASGITDARLRVVRGTSHLAPYQTPGPVTAAILSHLGAPEKLR